MSDDQRRPRRRRGALFLLTLALLMIPLGNCGGDDESVTPTAIPSPPASPSPAPSHQVTAVGELLIRDEGTVEKNTIVLTFDSRGGPVSGEGHDLVSAVHECGEVWYSHDIVFSGSYDQETGQLSGTAERTMRSETFRGPHPICQRVVADPYVDERPWQAQLAGDLVTGTVAGWRFELVVQGQQAAD